MNLRYVGVCVCVCVCHTIRHTGSWFHPPGIKPGPPAVEVLCLNHWTIREIFEISEIFDKMEKCPVHTLC